MPGASPARSRSEQRPGGRLHRGEALAPGDTVLLMLQAFLALVLGSFAATQLRAGGLYDLGSPPIGYEGEVTFDLLQDLRCIAHFAVGGALCLAFWPEMRPRGLLGKSNLDLVCLFW